MESSKTVMTEGGGAEEEYLLRLRALLHYLVRKKGRFKAANELGLDPRTIGACMDGEGMSWRVREALDRALQEGSGPAAARQRERNEALERRVDALEKEMNRRLTKVEAHLRSQGGAGVLAGSTKPVVGMLGRRRYPELVTKDPADDDEEAFGEAWPLVDEWRRLWQGHSNEGKGLSWLRTEERVRELEVAMLERHGLTLPPETEPLCGLDRSSQLNWRKETLNEVRVTRARRELLCSVRQVLTLGLWRK